MPLLRPKTINPRFKIGAGKHVMSVYSFTATMPRSDRPSTKGFDFAGQGLSAGGIQKTVQIG